MNHVPVKTSPAARISGLLYTQYQVEKALALAGKQVCASRLQQLRRGQRQTQVYKGKAKLYNQPPRLGTPGDWRYLDSGFAGNNRVRFTSDGVKRVFELYGLKINTQQLLDMLKLPRNRSEDPDPV